MTCFAVVPTLTFFALSVPAYIAAPGMMRACKQRMLLFHLADVYLLDAHWDPLRRLLEPVGTG